MLKKRFPNFPGSPPPNFVPTHFKPGQEGFPEIFFQYLNRHIYVWTKGGGRFWMFPVQLDDRYLYGYVWRNGWKPEKVAWRAIEGFF